MGQVVKPASRMVFGSAGEAGRFGLPTFLAAAKIRGDILAGQGDDEAGTYSTSRKAASCAGMVTADITLRLEVETS